MQKISINKNLVLTLFEIIDRIKRSDSSVTQQDMGYLRLLIDLAYLETKGNKKKIKISTLN